MPIIFQWNFTILLIKCWFYFYLHKNVGETRGTIPGQVMTSSLSQPTRDVMKTVSTNERSASETSDQAQARNHPQCSSLWPTNTSGCTVTVRGISESCLLSDLTWSCPGSWIRRAIWFECFPASDWSTLTNSLFPMVVCWFISSSRHTYDNSSSGKN